MGLFCVYMHRMPNGKVYIGLTGQNVNKRWRNGKGYPQNSHLTNAIKRYGWDNIEHVIVADKLTKEQAARIEQLFVTKFRSNEIAYGYNQSSGGEFPATGSKWTDEMKKKNSESHKGKRNSAEHNANISLAKKGKPNGRQGKTGALCPKSKLVRQIDKQTGKTIAVYHGCPEASRATGIGRTAIQKAASGTRKGACGYLWEYCGGHKNGII